MIGFLITLLIVVLIVGLAWWILDLLPIEPSFKQIARVILLVIVLLVLISALLGYLPVGAWPKAWCALEAPGGLPSVDRIHS
jgi:uncharacterized membrane protein YwzB